MHHGRPVNAGMEYEGCLGYVAGAIDSPEPTHLATRIPLTQDLFTNTSTLRKAATATLQRLFSAHHAAGTIIIFDTAGLLDQCVVHFVMWMLCERDRPAIAFLGRPSSGIPSGIPIGVARRTLEEHPAAAFIVCETQAEAMAHTVALSRPAIFLQESFCARLDESGASPTAEFRAYDARTGTNLGTMHEGQDISVYSDPTLLFYCSAYAHSCSFFVNKANIGLEYTQPFCISGRTRGRLNSFDFPAGEFDVMVCLFDANGRVLTTAQIMLTNSASVGADGARTASNPLMLTNIANKTFKDINIIEQEGAVSVYRARNIVFENVVIRGCGADAFFLSECDGITIRRCIFENVRAGVVAENCKNVRVVECAVRNINGDVPRGQFVHFSRVHGGECAVVDNVIINENGRSATEDLIKLTSCHGEFDAPIRVERNYISGGGPSNSSGGIMLGDQGGSNQIARHNTLMNPGQYGVCCVGGKDICIEGNTIMARQQTMTRAGIFVWEVSHLHSVRNVRVVNNVVSFINRSGRPAGWYCKSGDVITLNNEWLAQYREIATPSWGIKN